MHLQVNIFGIAGIPEVSVGDDLASLILKAVGTQGTSIQQGDVVVITQKVVSKAEGRVIRLIDVEPSPKALKFAQEYGRNPRHIEVIFRESHRIVRIEQGIIISETRHGFKCANAGVDISNLPDEGTVALLPEYPDASANCIRLGIEQQSDLQVAVIICDSFGRPWREGIVNVAIGAAGLHTYRDLRGTQDAYGHPLSSTVVAVADELAAAAGMVMDKDSGIPVAVIRGYRYHPGEQGAEALVRPADRDLFR